MCIGAGLQALADYKSVRKGIRPMEAREAAGSVRRASFAAARGQTALSAGMAFLLGLFLLYGAGFAQPDALHNAAHDTRHAFVFPCH